MDFWQQNRSQQTIQNLNYTYTGTTQAQNDNDHN